MTESAVVFTTLQPGNEAGMDLGKKIKEKLKNKVPNVVIVFASSVYDYDALLTALRATTETPLIIGGSSAGEFTSVDFNVDSACAVGICSDEMKFSGGVAVGINKSREAVAEELFSNMLQDDDFKYKYCSAMIFADALSGYTDQLIELLTELTTGRYQFFGGGAGDNANFQRTHVFFNDTAYTDAAVILEILSNKPVGVGISHGWVPASNKMRVTEAEGRRLISLNSKPAIELYKEYAKSREINFDVDQPIPFFLSNIIGIELANDFKLRAPLAIEPDGSIILASDVPTGAYVYIMASSAESAQRAAVEATSNALRQLGADEPDVAIFFDCVATRLRLGDEFDIELSRIKDALKGVSYAGCNTYGQVARVNGQFSGFQNCSAVVCVIPK
jgi:hypothetical protein